MPGIDAFADRLSSYLGPDQVNLVRRAYYYAEQAHDGQRRRSGEPYVTHPLAVSNILADMHMDHQSLRYHGNIEKISMDERDGRISVVQLVVSVHDRVHLARVIKKLRALKGVIRITRLRS